MKTRRDCFRRVNLAKKASHKFDSGEATGELLCDYYSVINWLFPLLDKRMCNEDEIPFYAALYGGDYHEYAKRIQSFVKALRHLHIEPVFFVDAPVGADKRNMETKFSIYEDRHMGRIETDSLIQRFCDGAADCHSVQLYKIKGPMFDQGLKSLEDIGVNVVYCLGEADCDIECYSMCHNNVFGVLSTDTDFAIMSHCQLLHIQYFDIDNSLGLNRRNVCLTPDSLVCLITSPCDLAECLNIREDQLIDFAILCGNDICNRNIAHDILGIDYTCSQGDVLAVAEWLRSSDVSVKENDKLKRFLAQPENYALKSAVDLSYAFYGHTLPNQTPPTGVDVVMAKHISGRVIARTMNQFFAFVNSGVVWHHETLQPTTLGQLSVPQLTLSLRKLMYVMLGLHSVIEYGRSDKKPLAKFRVRLKNARSGGIKLLDTIAKHTEQERLCMFFSSVVNNSQFLEAVNLQDRLLAICSTLCDGSSSEVSLQRYVVTSAALIYMYNLEGCQSLSKGMVTTFRAVLVSCLLCLADIPPCKVMARPPTNALFVASQFCGILHTVGLVADLFCLHGIVPQPKDVFYPMAFIPYYMAAIGTDDPRLQQCNDIFSRVLRMESVIQLNSSLTSETCIDPVLLSIQFRHAVDDIADAKSEMFTSLSKHQHPPDVHFQLVLTQSDVMLLKEKEKDVDEDEALEQVASDEDEVDSTEITCDMLHDQAYFEEDTIDQNLECVYSRVDDRVTISERKAELINYIKSHQVSCIVGETGTGKTTKVPQLLLSDLRTEERISQPQKCVILVTQPNSLAMLKAAKYVSCQIKERVGQYTVADCTDCPSLPLTYCTYACLCEVSGHFFYCSCFTFVYSSPAAPGASTSDSPRIALSHT